MAGQFQIVILSSDPGINLKSLNQFVRMEHIKMEGLHLYPDLESVDGEAGSTISIGAHTKVPTLHCPFCFMTSFQIKLIRNFLYQDTHTFWNVGMVMTFLKELSHNFLPSLK